MHISYQFNVLDHLTVERGTIMRKQIRLNNAGPCTTWETAS